MLIPFHERERLNGSLARQSKENVLRCKIKPLTVSLSAHRLKEFQRDDKAHLHLHPNRTALALTPILQPQVLFQRKFRW